MMLGASLFPAPAQAARPVSLTLIGQWPAGESGRAHDITVLGHYTYVADGYAGSQVIDVSEPANPVRVGGFSGCPNAVAVSGNVIYVAVNEQGLLILEQSILPPPRAEWVQVQTDPASTPPARAFHGMVYDSERGVVLLHGGNPAPGFQNFTDTWAWDGTRWTRLTTQGPRVLGFGFAFDSNRGFFPCGGSSPSSATGLPVRNNEQRCAPEDCKSALRSFRCTAALRDRPVVGKPFYPCGQA